MKKARGNSYPGMSLESAIAKLRDVQKAINKTAVSRLEIVKAMKYEGVSGPSGRAIATLGYYGLIEKRPGSAYALSELGMSVLFAEGEDHRNALKEAALKPDLYGMLYERYSGAELPSLQSLQSALVLSYSINSSNAELAAKNFVATMQFAELVDENGTVISPDAERHETEQASSASTNSELSSGETSTATVNHMSTSTDDMNKFEIALSEGRKALIAAPSGLLEADKNKLRAAIDLL